MSSSKSIHSNVWPQRLVSKIYVCMCWKSLHGKPFLVFRMCLLCSSKIDFNVIMLMLMRDSAFRLELDNWHRLGWGRVCKSECKCVSCVSVCVLHILFLCRCTGSEKEWSSRLTFVHPLCPGPWDRCQVWTLSLGRTGQNTIIITAYGAPLAGRARTQI